MLRRPRLGPLLLLTLHTAALALFTRGFLLTRVHLAQRNSDPPTASPSPPPYDRVVWLMIDALRYDFVVADGRYRCPPDAAVCHQGHMPYLSSLAARTVSCRPPARLLPSGRLSDTGLPASSSTLRLPYCPCASKPGQSRRPPVTAPASRNSPCLCAALPSPPAGRRPLLHVCGRRAHHHHAAAQGAGHRRAALLLRRVQLLHGGGAAGGQPAGAAGGRGQAAGKGAGSSRGSRGQRAGCARRLYLCALQRGLCCGRLPAACCVRSTAPGGDARGQRVWYPPHCIPPPPRARPSSGTPPGRSCSRTSGPGPAPFPASTSKICTQVRLLAPWARRRAAWRTPSRPGSA